ncbi:hypothetical protein HHK36_010369 [Tetracentron sinense]|uniref:procollagen-proline 4-dioxygenase n=1 Tax=Tetracentron sinense TaxID=13715 RepID=A0A835DJ37_TETSI|nr:hypothetical protein HHK36_010369 [Tetracentron sinense]
MARKVVQVFCDRFIGFRSLVRSVTMAKLRHTRLPGRRSSSFPLVLAVLVLSIVLLLLLSLGIFSIPINTGDSPKANDLSSFVRKTEERGHELEETADQWTEILSWEPRAFIYHNFLVCFWISFVLKKLLYLFALLYLFDIPLVCRVRTSFGTFLKRGQDQIIRKIEKRIADFTFMPVEHGEGLQFLHYEVGQKYEPHYDYFLDEFNTKNGGQRMATVLTYLSDVEEGGETVFPAAKGNFSSVPWWNELSECGKKGLSVKPKMGDALLFWNTKPDATLDHSSLHGGCAVIKGNKWSFTKWMRVNEYKI